MKALILAGSLAVLALLAGGCSSTTPGIAIPNPTSATGATVLTGNPIQDFAPLTEKLAAYAIPDVTLALADAKAQVPPDYIGIGCWQILLGVLPGLQVPAGAAGAYTIQKARDAQTDIPSIVKACSGILPFIVP